MTATLSCAVPDCSLGTDGRCLEGFAEPSECPNSFEIDNADVVRGVGADTLLEDGLPSSRIMDAEEDEDDAPTVKWVHVGGEVALTVEEADLVAQESPSRVVLVAGEFESGKTTLVVELYAQYLRGPFADSIFGGSRTLRAFDLRHHPARAESGEAVPVTDRTAEEDMRLLHLRLQRGGRAHSVLFSDVRGEFFENVIDGAAVTVEVPLARRSNACLLLIDGASISDVYERQATISRARLLVAGLTEPGGLRPGSQMVMLLTKGDLLSDDAKEWVRSQVGSLESLAQSRGLVPEFMIVAARPPDSPPQGLEAVLDRVLGSWPESVMPESRSEPGDRQFWTQPEVVT